MCIFLDIIDRVWVQIDRLNILFQIKIIGKLLEFISPISSNLGQDTRKLNRTIENTKYPFNNTYMNENIYMLKVVYNNDL